MKIYVSSTRIDLAEYCQSVISAVRSLKHNCIAMEDYTAEARLPVEKCLDDVSKCDAYIGLFAWRYGFVPNGYQKAITELEYLEATKLGIPTIIFLLDEEVAWPLKYIDRGDQRNQIDRLREELKKDRMVKFFNSPADLAAKASQAIANLVLPPPDISIGDEKTVKPVPPRISLLRLPTTGGAEFGRDAELKKLDDAWENGRTNIVTLVAWGGMGKSALTTTWLAQMAKEGFRGAESVFGWSFYNQETDNPEASADVFSAEALGWFGDPQPSRGSPWEKGQRLVELVRSKRTLLILDGLEVLQQDDGKLKDQSLQALLVELAWQNPGLCLISTRLPVGDLQSFINNTVDEISLSSLNSAAGADLLTRLGVVGTRNELLEAADAFGGHALALTLLGSYLTEYRDGDVHWWHEIPEEGDQARRVMDSYEKWLGDGPELDILRLLGLFDGPAHIDAIRAICDQPVINGLTESLLEFIPKVWNHSVNKLRRLNLVSEKNLERPKVLDAHPLVRQHFSQQLQSRNPTAWREANNRLFEYFKRFPKMDLPETLSEMAPLFQAVVHGCRAERHQEAWNEVYWPRIRRKEFGYSVLALNAYGADLAAISNFFEDCWDRPVKTLDDLTKSQVFTEAGFDLRGLGRLSESVSTEHLGLNAHRAKENWWEAADAAGNLSETLATMGDLKKAAEIAELSIELAEKSQDLELLVTNLATLADVLHQQGEFELSEEQFKAAESQLVNPSAAFLHAFRGYHYCDLLLSLGKFEEVFPRVENSLRVDQERPYAVALAHLAAARGLMMKTRNNDSGNLDQAAEMMNKAVNELKLAGHQELVVRGLLASAKLNRLAGRFEEAEEILKEVHSTAIRNQMGLHLADAYLQFAYLHLEMSQIESAAADLENAKSKINSMGYFRRNPEIAELDAMIKSQRMETR